MTKTGRIKVTQRCRPLFKLCRAAALLLALLGGTVPAWSQPYTLHADGARLLGRTTYHIVERGETLPNIAKDYDVGYLALVAANPGIDPFAPSRGYALTIPTQLILPNVQRSGIVINLAELRLYYFDPDEPIVHIFPVGIGRVGRETPKMVTRISQKRANPTWVPPKSVRKDYLERGITLPSVVPPGPDNPLGLFALRLAYGSGQYLIHGTNKEYGIGARVSAGCIRMAPADIEWLYHQVDTKTQVRIINQPIKMAREPDQRIYLEVHEPLTKADGKKQTLKMPRQLRTMLNQSNRDEAMAEAVIASQNGVPVKIDGR
ncbi:L,D-transpeptidase family protein [Vibrio sp. SM6]|uniref:L,D-transpeptidase family protein n=1 Tax=Vibrio agarilyticus TaxID=2726741 RepID=A0A7X8TNE0_9VIBR|nr:L,D-transpeptidase family protein [Vibrio agarilyticus]